MVIYGSALLSLCLLIGLVAGQLLGKLVGVDKNIGGVGIAMLVLILVCDRLQRAGHLPVPTQQGILFWSAIYIPIVVAMAASQNVIKAVGAGPVALLAGLLSVALCFALVPLISRVGAAARQDAEQS